MVDVNNFLSPATIFSRELDSLSGEHNTAANVHATAEAFVLDAVLKSGVRAMCSATFGHSFFRYTVPRLTVGMAEVWGYWMPGSETFRPILTGYLTGKYHKVLNIGCGANTYTVYEMGWSSESSPAMKDTFRGQRDCLASVTPERNMFYSQSLLTYSFIDEQWCNDSQRPSVLSTSDCINFVLARDCAINIQRGSNLCHAFSTPAYDGAINLAVRTGNVLWIDGKRADQVLTCENLLTENVLVAIKAELREVVNANYLTGINEHHYFVIAHELYIVQ
ncbi:hypothetical protein EV361DRAFT_943826 [Lentinula raphanica]|nr:hypothetical protein EV361DRAFT_943826 [Lentinula raphanica]